MHPRNRQQPVWLFFLVIIVIISLFIGSAVGGFAGWLEQPAAAAGIEASARRSNVVDGVGVGMAAGMVAARPGGVDARRGGIAGARAGRLRFILAPIGR